MVHNESALLFCIPILESVSDYVHKHVFVAFVSHFKVKKHKLSRMEH